MTAAAFPAFHSSADPQHAVVRVDHVHVTRFVDGEMHYGANVFNAGPGGFFDYRIGVSIIVEPEAIVAPVTPPGTIGEIFPVTAFHNNTGEILSLIARSPGSPPANLEMRQGQRATEIKVPELTRELDSAQIFDLLSDLAENRQVEARGATGVLKPRK
jgi:hypothetical protein